MRVGIEISNLFPHLAGINTYTLALLEHLESIEHPPELFLLDGLGRRSRREVMATNSLTLNSAAFLQVTWLPSLTATDSAWARSFRSRAFAKAVDRLTTGPIAAWARTHPSAGSFLVRPEVRSLDVCHWSDRVWLDIKNVASVATIHDTIVLRHPEWFTPHDIRLHTRKLVTIERHATRVIADSESTKRDVMNLVGIEEDRIDVIPLAAGETFRPPDDPLAQDALLTRYGLQRQDYVLYVGTIEPRKNLVRLAQAFKAVIERQPALTTRLVLAGRTGWLTDEINAGLAALGLGDRLVMPGRVPQDELPALLSGARVVGYVSMYEGFGLPPLEAMASGAAVIASNTTSLPEVVGDGGILVDPLDVGAIATAMERVLLDDELHAGLVERGLRQATRFSWNRTAELTMGTYRRAIAAL
jgi:glycosyltransferase involved in cell wall biosynthesis